MAPRATPVRVDSLLLAALLSCVLSSCAMFEHEGEHDWREMPHHLSVLVAGTFEEEESAPSVGLDYEYRTTEFLGLGAVVEYAFDDIDASTLLGVADLHFSDQFIMQTGPGVEFIDGEEEFVYRVGLLYEFERRGTTWSPQLHYDATSGKDAVVAGIAVGFGF